MPIEIQITHAVQSLPIRLSTLHLGLLCRAQRWPSPKEASKLFYDVCAWHFYRKGIGMSVSHRYLVLIKFH